MRQRLKVDEATQYLGVSRATLFSYIRQGRLHPIRLSPRKVFFEQSDLDALLAPEDIVRMAAGLWCDDLGSTDGVAYVELLRRGPSEDRRQRRTR